MRHTVNIYLYQGEWCYALFTSGEFDHSDTLGVVNGSSAIEAETEALAQFPRAEVQVVVIE